MFTGIIEGTARIKSITNLEKGIRAGLKLTIDLGKLGKGIKIGNSVSINGACLTVTRTYEKQYADFEIVGETIRRTALGSLGIGDKVNIERSLRLGDRIEGHLVLGHIDSTASIEDITIELDGIKLWIRLKNKKLLRYVVPKGSIAVDGVSLTVVDVNHDKFSVALIPHTAAVTTLGERSKGDLVNIEIDIVSRYVNLLQPTK
ncbi:MAG: riboflavin synthase [Nitrososphaeraceae archaeon]